MHGGITIRDLVYRYPGIAGAFSLGPISLDVPTGVMTFLIGHNGSGKSTLARILCGEMVAQSGTIAGKNGSSIHHHQSLAENLFPELRVEDHFRLLSSRRDNRIGDIQRLFPELRTILKSYPDELSGGQLQLVAFATVLLENHDLYVFDEVLNHLDPNLSSRVMTYIAETIVTRKRAHCVIITHDLECVCRYARLAYILNEGQVAARLEGNDIADVDALARRLVKHTI